MESEWASYAFQPETTVLRLRLRPFSVGHEILLSLEKSPFLFGGTFDWHDLFTAVLFCSQTFREGMALRQSPRKVQIFAYAWKWFLSGRLNIISEQKAFEKYIMEGSWCPNVCEPISGYETRELKAPKAFRLIPFLCAYLNMSESEAMDFPMSRAQAYAAAIDDKEGKIDLEGKGEKSITKFLAELEEKAKTDPSVWGS